MLHTLNNIATTRKSTRSANLHKAQPCCARWATPHVASDWCINTKFDHCSNNIWLGSNQPSAGQLWHQIRLNDYKSSHSHQKLWCDLWYMAQQNNSVCFYIVDGQRKGQTTWQSTSKTWWVSARWILWYSAENMECKITVTTIANK